MKVSTCRWCVLVLAGSLLGACEGEEGLEPVDEVTVGEGATERHRPRTRNVILFIGDGMGPQQVAFLNQYRRIIQPDGAPTTFERLLERDSGLIDVHMLNAQGQETMVVDSAASATQIACGEMTITQVIGLDRDGYPCETVLERAHALGKATGLITDTRVTHATPAAFAAKQPSRDLENEIAADMLVGVSAGTIDVLLGGGGRHLVPAGTRWSDVPECAGIASEVDGSGRRDDGRNLVDEAKQRGYQFACDAAQLDQIRPRRNTRVLGVFARSAFPAYPERATVAGVPSLPTMTKKALDILERDRDGFFLMVEAGQIDWAAHDNDPAYLLAAMRDADATLEVLLRYVQRNPDTLLLVTADHETGGMGFSYADAPDEITILPSGLEHRTPFDFAVAAERFDYLEAQTHSFSVMIDDLVDELYDDDYVLSGRISLDDAASILVSRIEANTAFDLSHARARELLFVAPGTDIVPQDHSHDRFSPHDPFHNRLAQEFVDTTQIVWATGTHTNIPVQLMAAGPRRYTRRVHGYGHSRDVGRLIFDALANR